MTKQMKLTIENRIAIGRRDMNIYHHFTRSAHMISFDSSITLPLRTITDGDYLHISIVSGPGRLESSCIVDLPSWIDFELYSKGDVKIVHTSNRILVKIPPCFPIWQLKMTRSLSSLSHYPSDYIAIGDSQ